jgi:addiction module RelE/StbE family toxin
VTTLVWSASFVRALRRIARKDPQLTSKAKNTLEQLSSDPFHPSLRTHKLKGKLAGSWACSVDYNRRIVFDFVQNPDSHEEEILLLSVGSHDEVY